MLIKKNEVSEGCKHHFKRLFKVREGRNVMHSQAQNEEKASRKVSVFSQNLQLFHICHLLHNSLAYSITNVEFLWKFTPNINFPVFQCTDSHQQKNGVRLRDQTQGLLNKNKLLEYYTEYHTLMSCLELLLSTYVHLGLINQFFSRIRSKQKFCVLSSELT